MPPKVVGKVKDALMHLTTYNPDIFWTSGKLHASFFLQLIFGEGISIFVLVNYFTEGF